MEIAYKMLSGLFVWAMACLMAGFIDAWWEQRKREKNKGG